MDAHTVLSTLISQFQVLKYLQAGLYSFLVYDHLDLLSREVDAIWKRKWAKVNILYISCRYTCFVNLGIWVFSLTSSAANPELCVGMAFASAWVAFIGMSSAQLTFFLRTYALWGCSKIVAVFLSVLAIAMIGSGIIISSLIMRSTTRVEPPVHNATIIPQCFLTVTTSVSIGMWGVLNGRIIDIILVAMVIIAKFRMYRTTNSPLVQTIFRESMLYFGLNFFISITTTVIFFTFPGTIKQFPGTFMGIMYRCLASRMIVRLRELGVESLFTLSNSPASGLQFRRDDESCSGLTSTDRIQPRTAIVNTRSTDV